MDAGRYKRALSVLKTAAEMAPQRIETMMALGQCHFALNHPMNALKYFGKVTQEAPHYTPAYLELGVTLLAIGDAEESLRFLEHYTQAHPLDIRGLTALGQAHYKLNNFQQAEALYKQALKIEPDNQSIQSLISQAEQAQN